MTEKIREDMHRQIAEFLPGVIKSILNSYKEFIESEEFKNSKDFKKKHESCKAAIAHLQALIGLLEKAGFPAGQPEGEDIYDMLRQAREEIEKDEETYEFE